MNGQVPLYINWIMPEGKMALGIWDARLYNHEQPPWEQVMTALFWDTFTLAQALNLGAAFINLAVSTNTHYIQRLREEKLAQLQSTELSKPITEEELLKMSAFVEGLKDINFELQEQPGERNDGSA